MHQLLEFANLASILVQPAKEQPQLAFRVQTLPYIFSMELAIRHRPVLMELIHPIQQRHVRLVPLHVVLASIQFYVQLVRPTFIT